MKATISPVVLLKELKKMALVVQKTTVIPILKSVKFDFGKDKLTLTATDLETTYISKVDCKCEKPFLLLMEFNDIVSICNSVVAPLEINVLESSISLVSGKCKFKLSLLNETEAFPQLPTEEYFLEFDADGEFFYHLAIANSFTHDSDPRMNMVAVDISKDNIVIVATDSNSLYKKDMAIKTGKELITMIPGNFIGACKSFQDTKISIGEKFIKAEHKDEIVISLLSEQKFPNYKSVIVKDIQTNLVADRNELKSAVSSISIAANSLVKQIVISFSKDSITLKAQDFDLHKEGEMELEIENKVEFPQIAFNGDNLNHFLNNLTSETIDFNFSGEGLPIYLKPSDDESVFGLLLPIGIIKN